VIAPIGIGGMAAVLKARDTELGRIVALKLLPPDAAKDPEAVTRFKQEARAAARLDHDAVARVFASGEDRGQHFIAFEFVEGKTLRQLIDERGTIPPAECVRYLLDVATGLAHAAERGVVHRDVKPSNVIITPAGQAKLVDMGLARHRDAASVNGGVTRSGTTLGTFDYISPEQAMDPRRADVRSDIYSLGCTAYHALTGRPPVPEGTAAKKLHAHQFVPPLDPRVLNPAVPDDLALVLSRMLAKDPAVRYQTPAQLIAHLAEVASRLDVSVSGVSVSTGPAVRLLPEPPRASFGLLAGVGAVAAAVLLAVGTSGRPADAGRPPWDAARAVRTTEPGTEPVTPSGTPSPKTDGYRTAASATELARLLRDGVAKIRLEAGKEYDLSFTSDGVAFTGPELTLDGPLTGEQPIVRLAATALDGQPRAGSLTVRGAKKLKVTGIHFVLVGSPEGEELPAEATGLWTDAESVEVVGCRWESDEAIWSTKAAALAFVRESSGTLHLSRVMFGPGAVAVRLAGPVAVDAEECGFGPHDAVFDVSQADGTPRPRATVALRHCTVLFKPTGGTVLEVDNPNDAHLTSGYCLYAASGAGTVTMPGMTVGDTPPVLVRCDGSKATEPVFSARPSEPNSYYRVEPYSDGMQIIKWDRAREQGFPGVADSTAIRLAAAPWVDPAPLTAIQSNLAPWAAFKVRFDQMPTVRLPGEAGVIGLREQPKVPDIAVGPKRIYAGAWPPPARRVADYMTEKVKIWWPRPKPADILPPNASPNLALLVAAAAHGDEIQIHFDGELPVPPVALLHPGTLLTIRPYAGCKPILTPDPASRLLDTTLFQIADGALILDGLQMKLPPRIEPVGDSKPRSVVRVTGGAGVTLRNCLVTLADEDDRSAAVSAGGMEEMRKDPAERAGPGPQVRIENTLIRGRGKGVWVSTGRGFGLEMSNVMTALEGPIVSVDPAAKDMAPSARGRMTLSRVTAALGGPVLEQRAGRNGSAVPVDVSAERCLFAPVGTARPLVRMDVSDPAGPEKFLTWQADGPNLYANFDRSATVLEVRPAEDDGTTPLVWDGVDWMRFTKESGKSMSKARFGNWPDGGRDVAETRAADLRLLDVTDPDLTAVKPGAVGADADAIPKPWDE
jgi:hypothetical protein